MCLVRSCWSCWRPRHHHHHHRRQWHLCVSAPFMWWNLFSDNGRPKQAELLSALRSRLLTEQSERSHIHVYPTKSNAHNSPPRLLVADNNSNNDYNVSCTVEVLKTVLLYLRNIATAPPSQFRLYRLPAYVFREWSAPAIR